MSCEYSADPFPPVGRVAAMHVILNAPCAGPDLIITLRGLARFTTGRVLARFLAGMTSAIVVDNEASAARARSMTGGIATAGMLSNRTNITNASKLSFD